MRRSEEIVRSGTSGISVPVVPAKLVGGLLLDGVLFNVSRVLFLPEDNEDVLVSIGVVVLVEVDALGGERVLEPLPVSPRAAGVDAGV